MTEFISTYSIDFNDLKLSIDTSDWESLLLDNDGSFMRNYEFLININGVEVYLDSQISVSGVVSFDRGNYWTPASSDIKINSIDVDIKDLFVDEYEVELSKDLRLLLESKLNNLINV
jgi:hypothetical protein